MIELKAITMNKLSRRKYEVLNDYYHQYNGETHLIRKGLVTDLGSLPRLFYCLMPPNGLFQTQFIMHDQDYKDQVGKFYADKRFLRGCWYKNISNKYHVFLARILAVLFFIALFCFGWFAYRSYK